MAEKDEVAVRATGGQVDEIVMALIDSAYDKDPDVRSVMLISLRQLGCHQPALVLSSCYAYLGNHVKLPQVHRVVLLEAMQAIITEAVTKIDEDLARAIIKQASTDLTQAKDVVPEWQTAASGVLVALGGRFCHEVMEELQSKFQPGVLPHFFVVQTMANLASTNVYGMVPFMKVILGTMLPMLGLAKQDNMRWVFSSALCKFCEAILDYVANIEKAPDPSVKKEFFSSEINAAYDVLLNAWLSSKEAKLRVVIVQALGQMSHILTPDKLEMELPRLLQALLGLYRRHTTDPHHVTQGLGLVLGAASVSCVPTMEQHIDQLLSTLFSQMCQPLDYSNPVTVKNHNELLRCYTILAGTFSDILVSHLLQKLDGGNERTRIATVCILRHLVNSVDNQLEDKRAIILTGLRQLLNDPSNKVKKEVAQTVMAMSHHGYLELEGGQMMVEFIVRQCCPGPEPQKRPADPDYVSNEALRAMCENVLQLMSTTVDNMEKVLWPYLLEFLTPVQFSDAVGVLCQCVSNIAKHDVDGTAPLFINYEDQVDGNLENAQCASDIISPPACAVSVATVGGGYLLDPGVEAPQETVAPTQGTPTSHQEATAAGLDSSQALPSPTTGKPTSDITDISKPLPTVQEPALSAVQPAPASTTNMQTDINPAAIQIPGVHQQPIVTIFQEVDESKWCKDDMTNVPKPTELVTRLLVMAGQPFNLKVLVGWPVGGRNRGVHVLHALHALAPHLGTGLHELWADHMTDLVQQYETTADDETWNQVIWEGKVLKLLEHTIDHMNSEDWTVSLGEALGHQLALYSACPHEKNFALKLLGIVMKKAATKEFISKHMDVIFNSVKHNSDLEREGCAVAMGHVGTTHFDPVLVKLEGVARNDSGKRSSGLFSFIKDSVTRSDVDEKTKATLILCYGYVTLHAPPALVTSRLETTIIKAIVSHFPHVKKSKDLTKFRELDVGVKQALIETTEMVGQSMHPEHLMTQHTFAERGELLAHMQNYLRLESPAALVTTTRALALNACATLVKLDPVLPEADTVELLKAALDCYIPLPVGGSTVQWPKEETYEEVVQKEALMTNTRVALETLLRELLKKCPTPDGLEIIFKSLHTWSLSPEDHERERALLLSLTVFAFYLQNMHITIGTSSHFSNLGSVLGRLVPRCTDDHPGVRQAAVDCVYTILCIALRYQGHGLDYEDPAVEVLTTMRELVMKNDSTTLFTISKEIAQTSAHVLPSDQLLPLLERLYEALADPFPQSSSGACVVLNAIIKARGGAVPNEVDPMLAALHTRLPLILCPQTYKGTLRVVRTLASHHLLATMTVLLNYRLPFNEHMLACWREIGAERTLVTSMVAHLLDVLARSLPYEERPGIREKDPIERTATPLPIAATCALTQLFLVDQAADQLTDRLPSILGAIMVRIASSINVKPPIIKYIKEYAEDEKTKDKSKDKKSHSGSTLQSRPAALDPCGLSVEALRCLLVATGGQAVVEGLETADAWSKFRDEETSPEAFTMLIRLIVVLQPQHVCKLINVLNPTLASVYEPQRIMVAAVFAELINQQCAGDLALVEMLVNSLLGRLVDPAHRVRRLCIRGLGNVASVGREQVQRHSTTVLSAMMAGMDDKDDMDDQITLEAMSGLSRILAQIDEAHIRAILINIALRIRPCFEKEKPTVRAAAFTLFGDLSRFGDGPSKAPFLEQIHTNFVTLLLHLHDPDPSVRKACKYSLRLLGPLVGSDAINTMFQRHLPEAAALHYGEFMNDLSKAIIHDFPDKLNFYVMGNVTFFRSWWSDIRSNAAMFVGFLLGNAPEEAYVDVSKEHVCSALVMLLKDTSPEVRVKAAEAMSRLYSF